jgi:hypothetical protein
LLAEKDRLTKKRTETRTVFALFSGYTLVKKARIREIKQ